MSQDQLPLGALVNESLNSVRGDEAYFVVDVLALDLEGGQHILCDISFFRH
jgi:hypothetical protein